MFGWHPIEDMINGIKEFLFEQLKEGVKGCLNITNTLFEKSVETVRNNVSETPSEFSQTIVDNLRVVSDTTIIPVAGLFLTYLFCYEIFHMVTQKNKGGDFDTGEILFLIIKTACSILLITNAFTISLAFFDLGKWITDKIPDQSLSIPNMVTENILGAIPDNSVGMALTMLALALVIMIVTFFMSGIIYLVAWSRIIIIMLYISAAPIPFATLMTDSWVNSIGQNFIKSLLALMLQGYFMIALLLVYGGLIEKATTIMLADGDPIYGMVLMLVSMGILVVTLTRTHSFAKQLVGAN